MSAPLKIFIGYDPRSIVAYTVLQSSIIRRASRPVSITPLVLNTLPVTRRGLTEFTYSRFLCPWLCGYKGWSVFLDADMLVLGDIEELLECTDEGGGTPSDVFVVKNPQRFEWPSLMIFDNERCRALTPEFVETGPNPLKLEWALGIGSIPAEWNHCIGYDAPRPDAKLVHFTQGLPCFPECADTEYAKEWRDEMMIAASTRSWSELMGSSVHAKHVRERLERQAGAQWPLSAPAKVPA